MRRVGIETVAEVAQFDEDSLITLLGKGAGRKLHALAHNRDPRPVVVGARRRSMGTQRALGSRRQRSWEELDSILVALVDRLTRRLRRAERVCRTATLRMRHVDFARSTRSHTLTEATASTMTILEAFRDLLRDARPLIERRGLTLLGITLTNLADAGASSSRCRSSTARRARSTPRSTTSATATAPTRSSARCCSAATPGSRCRCCRTERPRA